MSIVIATLAADIVGSLLVPFLKTGADELAQKFGKESASLVGKVWDKVKELFSSDDDKTRIKDFEDDPDSTKQLITNRLENLLKKDPSVAQELSKLIEEITTSSGVNIGELFAGGNVVTVGGDVGGQAVLSGGNIHMVRNQQSGYTGYTPNQIKDILEANGINDPGEDNIEFIRFQVNSKGKELKWAIQYAKNLQKE